MKTSTSTVLVVCSVRYNNLVVSTFVNVSFDVIMSSNVLIATGTGGILLVFFQMDLPFRFNQFESMGNVYVSSRNLKIKVPGQRTEKKCQTVSTSSD